MTQLQYSTSLPAGVNRARYARGPWIASMSL